MVYLHKFLTARDEIRKLTPKLIAGIMPILDREGCEYQALQSGQPEFESGADSLIVTLPDGFLPEGYRLRIDFVPVNQAPWKAPDGAQVEGPGF